jgi:hypothetical protein
MNTAMTKIAYAFYSDFQDRADEALKAARSGGYFLRNKVTRELVREQAAESNVCNLLAAIVAGLNDGMEERALKPFCEIAKEEVEAAMRKISQRNLDRLRAIEAARKEA